MEKKLKILIKKVLDVSSLVTTGVVNTNICEVDNKIPNVIGLMTTAILNTKTEKVENIFC